MGELLELNRSAYQYHEARLPIFLKICQPLFDLGIHFFGYSKIFKDGSYLSSSTNNIFSKQYFSNIKNQGMTSTLQIESALFGQSHHFIFSTDIASFDKIKDAMPYLVYTHNIWPLYIIYKNRAKYVEAYTFGMNIVDGYDYQFYMKNMHLLEHFCTYFNECAGDLINADDRRKRAWFQQQFNFSKLSAEDKWMQQAEEFLLKTQMKQLTLQGKSDEVLLSKRETDCVRYLALGKSAKEIGEYLCLSPRTIESYLKNIKAKTRHTHSSDVISSYLSFST